MKIYSNLLKVRDESGEFIDIPAIKGDTGEKGEKGDQGAGADVVDNLTSASTTSALSANQGKVLEDKKLDTSDLDSKLQETLPTLLVNDGLISLIKRDSSGITDLNDMNIDGYYFLEDILYDNSPLDKTIQGRLHVYRQTGAYNSNGTIYQELYINRFVNVYRRYRLSSDASGTWSDWVEDTNSGNLETQMQTTLPSLIINNGLIAGIRKSSTSADFNEYTEDGLYHISKSGMLNAPYESTGTYYGLLEVSSSYGVEISSTRSGWQRYYEIGTSTRIYFRSYNWVMGWGDWVELTHSGNISSHIHRVGDIVVTSENVSPAGDFGGSWTLVDKGFKDDVIYTYSTSDYFTPDDDSYMEHMNITRCDNNINLRMTFGYAGELSKQTVQPIGALILSSIGVTTLQSSKISTNAGESINAIIQDTIAVNGDVWVDNIFLTGTDTSITGAKWIVDLTYTIKYTNMIDSFCDKFYWKKVS